MPNERNRRKLTKTLIASLHPQSKEYAVWDSECPGFGVRILPSGRKSYFVMYRDERRRTKRQTLGAVDTKDVSSARKEARQALADIEVDFENSTSLLILMWILEKITVPCQY